MMNKENISIHAPPRGATNHAPCEAGKKRFQFTPLREGRQGGEVVNALLIDFNSRPSARGDLLDFVNKLLHILFQFTPLREGRR